ncbi:MAG: hypothetical protein ACI9BD_000101 [Candidatus Marinamargulisbacteria bacterium]|jgi:hypothetical protein
MNAATFLGGVAPRLVPVEQKQGESHSLISSAVSEERSNVSPQREREIKSRVSGIMSRQNRGKETSEKFSLMKQYFLLLKPDEQTVARKAVHHRSIQMSQEYGWFAYRGYRQAAGLPKLPGLLKSMISGLRSSTKTSPL